jgi:GNAT superfamily N-acetyltransferase
MRQSDDRYRIAWLTHDDQRREVDVLLRGLLADTAAVPMQPVRWEAGRGFDSLVLGLYTAAGGLIGGLWAGDPYTEFMIDPEAAANPRHVQVAHIRSLIMLHHVGVSPEHQRHGLGRQLLSELDRYARRRRKDLVYGVTGPDSVAFYEAAGYDVGGLEEAIVLQFPRQFTMAWPIEGEARWFARSTADGRTRATAYSFSRLP